MPKPESGTDFAFLLDSYRFVGKVISDERYVIMKMENGLKAPRFGKQLRGKFSKTEKEKLEDLLRKVQSPGFKG